MKHKLILSIFLFNMMAFTAFTAFGQTNLKVGYADIEYILGNMPETVKAQADLDIVKDKLVKTRDSLVVDYNAQLKAYKKNVASLAPENKKETEKSNKNN